MTVIRTLEEKDLEACVEICVRNFKIEGYAYDVVKTLRSYFNLNQFIRPEYFVYEDNQVIKGVAGFSETGFDSGIYGLFMCYVHPDFQHAGIGRALTEKRIEMIRKKGGLAILSTTRKIWHLARFGFKEIASPYTDWHIMQLIL